MAWVEARNIWQQYQERPKKLTSLVILAMSILFFLEIILAFLLDAPSIESLLAYLFIHHPIPMWLLAPLLHRGSSHFLVNIVLLGLLAPVEEYLSVRDYGLIFFFAGFVSTYIGGAYIAVFSSKPHVAFYGTSGFVYGLAGFALLYTTLSLSHRVQVDWLPFIFGLSALLVVGANLVAGFRTPLALNPGHVSGFLLGLGYWIYRELGE